MRGFVIPLPLLLALCAGLGNTAGALLVTYYLRPGYSPAHRQKSRRSLAGLTQLGAGILIAAVVIEFIPAALGMVRSQSRASFLILGGYIAMHLLEKVVLPRFRRRTGSVSGGLAGETGVHSHGHVMEPSMVPSDLQNTVALEGHTFPPLSRSTFYSLATGLVLHSFFDGVSIGAAAQLSPSVTVLVFFAILLHKMPEGAMIASVALAANQGERRAFAGAVLIGCATVIGAVLVGSVNSAFAGTGIALGAGVTLYVAATELIPSDEGGRGAWFVLFGAALFALSDAAMHRFGLS